MFYRKLIDMKFFFSLILILVITYTSHAQGVDKSKTIPDSYNRSSLTVLFTDFTSDKHWGKAKSKVDFIKYSDKYDNNNLNISLLKTSFTRSSVVQSKLPQELNNDLLTEHIGRMVIARWYNRQPDGTMDMDLVHSRGRFSATDADFLLAQTSRRGNAALEDFGNRLVNLSFVLVMDISDIKTMDEAGNKDSRGWQASATGYLYRIDFNEEVRNAFYDTWIYEDDSENVKEQKRQAFNKLDIPVLPVTQKTLSVSASQPKSDKGTSLLVKYKSDDELLQELLQKSYDDILYRIEMDVLEFQIITPLYKTRPLRAKIGLKEGLKTDNRFYVYEHVYSKRKNAAVPVRRGVIRTSSKSKIIDNRREAIGDMGTSRFYQVHGRRLREGYTLRQKNDLGIEGSLGGEFGEIGGLYGRIDFRTGKISGIRALYVYGEGGVDKGDYDTFETVVFLRYGGGFAKGIQLTRNIELRPYVGAGVEQATNENLTEDEILTAVYVKPGINLALNLTHNFQIFGGGGVYVFVTEAEDKNGNTFGNWDELFVNRSGLSSFAGIKIGF
jgi:hypothetical protein